MDTPMSSEQMQSAIKELQETMIVLAHIEKMQSEHIRDLVEFRIQSEKLQMQSEKLRIGRRRTWRRSPTSSTVSSATLLAKSLKVQDRNSIRAWR